MDQAFVQHIKAPNDRSGNPRRLYLVTRTGPATHVYAVDEGYDNGGGLMRKLRAAGLRVFELPSIEVSPTQYKRLLQEYGDGRWTPWESGQ
ncbi:hypothetical protein [Dokdonella sp.]|uniref:hypothetical protein n=1 Tax=Dokdonella sp. TaxID=2291710 RepID=UPI0031C5BB2C|nr:hypothetical protein [Dokdonella sp.]